MGLPRVKELLKAEMERCRGERISIRKLALDIGISPASIYNYVDNDVTPGVDELRKIAKYFGTTVAELIGEIPAQKNTVRIVKSPAGDIFETTMAGRTADEKLEMMSKWLRLVKEYDNNKR